MSIRAIAWVLEQEIKSPTDKFVLVILANYVGDTGMAFPSTETIGRVTGLCRRSVVQALDRLVEQRWIEDTGKRTGRTKQVKAYRLSAAIESGKGANNTPLKGASDSSKGAADARLRVQQMHPEPLEEPLKEPKSQLSNFIESLKEDKRFDGLDVEVVVEEAVSWYRKKNKRLTRRGLQAWLDKELADAADEIEEDEEEAGSLACQPLYSWDGWTEERRRALLDLYPEATLPPIRWDKFYPDLKKRIEARVKEGWPA